MLVGTTSFGSPDYRAIVVGAGPAGILAAIRAAGRGRVLLLDRATLPRHKSCGGMLHALALDALRSYGSPPESMVLEPRWVSFRYRDWDRGSCKATDISFLNVDRAAFDTWLLGLLPANVEVVDGATLVSVVDEGSCVTAVTRIGAQEQTIRADVLIGADGARSRVRRCLFPDVPVTYVTTQDFVRLRGQLTPHFDCVYMRRMAGVAAFAYLVPKGEHAIIGTVLYPHTPRPRDLHEDIVAGLRRQIPQLGETTDTEAAAAICLRSKDDIRPGRGRILLAGEAGGFISPSSGEGISWALRSGEFAGMAASGDPARACETYHRLTRRLRADLERRLRWLPFMESSAGKYLSSLVPERIVSRATARL